MRLSEQQKRGAAAASAKAAKKRFEERPPVNWPLQIANLRKIFAELDRAERGQQ